MRNSIWIAVVVAVLLGLLGSVYVVREDQTAMVLNLGKVVRSDIKPGLHFKLPVVETVRVFDRRFQVLDTAPARSYPPASPRPIARPGKRRAPRRQRSRCLTAASPAGSGSRAATSSTSSPRRRRLGSLRARKRETGSP